MSLTIYNNLDFQKQYQLLNALLQVIAGSASSPAEGQVWYNSTAQRFEYRDSSGNRQIVTQTMLDTALASYQLTSEKGNANGYASLDGGGKIPASQLPSSVMEYKGTWNASSNTPTLADGTGNAGDTYRVTTAASRDLGSGSQAWGIGDLVIYDGAVWQRSDSTDAVTSVNGNTGTVVLVKGDVGLGNVDNTSDVNKPVSTAQQTALDLKANLASPALTGNPTAPTPSAADNDTSIATTAFVQGELAAKAPLASPALTGNPTAPTAAPGDSDTSIATTAFVAAAIIAAAGARKAAANITGNAVLTTFDVTHGLGTTDVKINVLDPDTTPVRRQEDLLEKYALDANTARIIFGSAVANAKVYRVVVFG